MTTNRLSTQMFSLVLAGLLVISPLAAFAHDGSDDQKGDDRGGRQEDSRGTFNLRSDLKGFFGFGRGEDHGKKHDGSDDRVTHEDKGVRADGNVSARIDVRITNLENLIDRVNDSDRLSADQKAAIVAGIEAQIDVLKGLQTRVANGESKADIKADLKAALKGKVLAMPKAGIEAAAERVLRIVDLGVTFADRLEARINDARDDGKDVSVSVHAHASLIANLNDAKAEANAALDLIADLSLNADTDAEIAENKRLMSEARADIEDAYKDLKDAREDARTILADLDIDFSDVK